MTTAMCLSFTIAHHHHENILPTTKSPSGHYNICGLASRRDGEEGVLGVVWASLSGSLEASRLVGRREEGYIE
jgi:hypothetical protein